MKISTSQTDAEVAVEEAAEVAVELLMVSEEVQETSNPETKVVR